jgi:Fic family protein
MRVIKRKKGREEYYFLQHSFRKDGKVITRERYLGKEIPRNIDEIRQELGKEAKKDLYRKLGTIKKNFQKEWKRTPKSARKSELKEIAIAFTYNTNAIEGSTITLEEAREIISDKISPNKPLNDVKETDAHSRVFLGMLENKEIISNMMLLGWHKEIFEGTVKDIAGRYRGYNVRVGQYIAPDWQDVTSLMNSLITYINAEKRINPVELSAIAHYRFERIHPFGDGNGRIGRLLMNYMLWHNGYPMLIIEYKKRKSYYKAFSKGEGAFIKYFMRRYLSVHKKRYLAQGE